MLYPVVTPESWIKRYPALGESSVCECDVPTLRPYRTRRAAGIECTTCDAGLWFLVKPEDNQAMLNIMP